ncbi:hypothetical protein [Streptomyces sp. NPDC102360]|uniref:hypothetical protein n=1 Tax=Streptomyces sp. NPDC102360 TaxID=3366160 RepID=UPI003824F5DA
MRLGRALATGIAEETPRETERPEVDDEAKELTAEATVRAETTVRTEAVVREVAPEPAEVPAAR